MIKHRLKRVSSRRLIQKQRQELYREFNLDTSLAAKAAFIVVLLFLLSLAIWQFPHLSLSVWLPYLVDLFAEGTLLFFCLYLLLNLVGFSRFLVGRTLQETLILYSQRLRNLSQIPSAFHLIPLNLEIHQRQQVLAFWRRLRQQQCARPPGCWSKSQAPILLFQQAPLLLAP